MPRLRATKKDRITALTIATQANPYELEAPEKVVVRASAYLPFIVRGPVLKKPDAKKAIRTGSKRK